MADGDYSIREMLIRMEGTLNVIASEHSHTQETVKLFGLKHDALANEVSQIQRDRAEFTGERKGFMMGARIIIFLSGVAGVGSLAAAAKTFIH